MSDQNVPMSKIYEMIGELFVNNTLLSSHAQSLEKKSNELSAKITYLEKQLVMLQGMNQNGSGTEE